MRKLLSTRLFELKITKRQIAVNNLYINIYLLKFGLLNFRHKNSLADME